MPFFVDSTELVWVEFQGQFAGWKVALKKEMDAGDQEDLENAMLGIEMDGIEGATPKPVMKAGGLMLLELNVKKIVSPEGKEIIPTPERIRQLHRAIRSRLLARIRELNPPLAELEKTLLS